tara:strand:+ start:1803 stop:2186 length:384 start_codon:yes stop_codon:yes gene_type:complete
MIGTTIINSARNVFKELGPGFAECIYHRAFVYELQLNKLNVENKKCIPINYKNFNVGYGEADIVVHDTDIHYILELKAISGNISEKEKIQLNTYRKNIDFPTIGYIINFPQPSTNSCKDDIDYIMLE